MCPGPVSDVPWHTLAACAGDPDAMYVKGPAVKHAKRICAGCEVRAECLTEALENGEDQGIWGGLTRLERRKLLATDVVAATAS